MDEAGEVEAYSSAAAQTYLSKIDDTLVTHVQRLVAGRISAGRLGIALDIGTGPGQIVRKLAAHLPGWLILGVDRSPNMVREAITARNADGNRAARVDFMVADANCLPFAGASFDLVLCNSVLHHFMDPARVLAEIARVAKPDGAVLVRDIVRPSRAAFPVSFALGRPPLLGIVVQVVLRFVARGVHVPGAFGDASPIAAACSTPVSARPHAHRHRARGCLRDGLLT